MKLLTRKAYFSHRRGGATFEKAGTKFHPVGSSFLSIYGAFKGVGADFYFNWGHSRFKHFNSNYLG